MSEHASVTGAECIHCGFCLETCPTYVLTGHEEESPRGRILLAQALQEGRLVPERETLAPLDHCLACLACETACPSGVKYGSILFQARRTADSNGHVRHSLERWLLLHVITHPNRLGWLVFLYRLLQVRRIFSMFARIPFLPKEWRERARLAPSIEPRAERYPRLSPPSSSRAAILLRGCAARVLMPATENAAAYLLAQAGYSVERRDDPRCCGALAHHAGLEHEAQTLARSTLDTLTEDSNAIIVPTAAGCGAHLRSLATVLSSASDVVKANALASRVRDLSQALLEAPRPLRFDPSHSGGTVVFQDPCHLRHAQKITDEPRRLLLNAGATLFEAEGADLCCGSAGSYHVAEPELSAPLARSKCQSLLAAGTETVVTANPGCWMQLRAVWPKDGPRLTTLARYLSERVIESSRSGLPTSPALQDDSSSSNPGKDAS